MWGEEVAPCHYSWITTGAWKGLTAEAVADAHRKDMEIQDQYGVRYHRYWFNEVAGEVFCLAEAPSKEAAEAVHREAHGLVADEIVQVKEGSWSLVSSAASLHRTDRGPER
jgi:hypothetical protein